ncbi:hypothetical protein [Pararhizobium arenae]|uniref:hypothetical protein n=1 Tax=Pararhizobium arenae TaxID=1856850 RepID=UPI000AE88637|nr:hypothetical protein [Pararhizobium arenae]
MPDMADEPRIHAVKLNPVTQATKPFDGFRYTMIRLGGVLVFAGGLHVMAGWLARQTF